jgi:hypothetical protein
MCDKVKVFITQLDALPTLEFQISFTSRFVLPVVNSILTKILRITEIVLITRKGGLGPKKQEV